MTLGRTLGLSDGRPGGDDRSRADGDAAAGESADEIDVAEGTHDDAGLPRVPDNVGLVR